MGPRSNKVFQKLWFSFDCPDSLHFQIRVAYFSLLAIGCKSTFQKLFSNFVLPNFLFLFPPKTNETFQSETFAVAVGEVFQTTWLKIRIPLVCFLVSNEIRIGLFKLFKSLRTATVPLLPSTQGLDCSQQRWCAWLLCFLPTLYKFLSILSTNLCSCACYRSSQEG